MQPEEAEHVEVRASQTERKLSGLHALSRPVRPAYRLLHPSHVARRQPLSRRSYGDDVIWTAARARAEATSCLHDAGDRWLHVQAVGRSAEELKARGLDVSDALVMAAWLHDVGYGKSVAATGFHPVDGARWLADQDAPPDVVALVAHHSGAWFEAEERGFADAIARFPEPDQDQLDVLTLIDMSTGPTGRRVSVQERLTEILQRYPSDHPVHRAVTRSYSYLEDSARRATERLGLADVRA